MIWILLLLLIGCRETVPPPDVPRASSDLVAMGAWDALLGKAVDDQGQVDYDLIAEEREALDTFLVHISGPVDAKPGTASLHFWINAYNALVIHQVLLRGKPGSVLDPKGWTGKKGSKFFWETQFKVGGEWLTLHEIEHEKIRMRTMDYRIHGALVCGARSCPPLRPGLYTRKKIGHQLDTRMRAWLQDPERGVRVAEDGVVELNPIFDWYARDFEFWSAGMNPCAIAAEHSGGVLRSQMRLAADLGCEHRFYEYDWRLNDARSQAPQPP